MRRSRIPSLLVVAGQLVGACGSSPGVVADDAWSRPVPPVSPASAIFLEVTNGSDSAITITGATSDECGAIEIHETSIDEAGVMAMRPVIGGLTVAPGASALLAPGVVHLMCIEPTIFAGSFEVILQMSNAADLPVLVTIEDR